jgi:hypothetical protein
MPLPSEASRLSILIPHESVWRVGGIDDPDFPSEASRLLILIPYESVWRVGVIDTPVSDFPSVKAFNLDPT